MMSKAETKNLILDLLEEEALVIGGLVAVHKIEDEVVWRLLRRLDDKDPDQEGGGPPRRPNLKPHPAIEDFLLSLRRG
jgi:hypothetical protein